MKHIVLTGGGTAGHVTPNIALIPRLRELGYQISYIGSNDGIESRLIPELGVDYYGISTGKLRRYLSLKNLSDPFKVLKGINDAWALLRRLKPDIIFSKGGFVAVPVVIAADHLHIPSIIHESDMTPGLANKMSARHASAFACNFPETLQYLPEGKGVVTGTPIRAELKCGNAEEAKKFCGFTSDKPVILVVGGSSGSVVVNEAVRSILPELLKEYSVIHLCGKDKLDPSLEGTEGYVQYEYIKKELADMFALADLVVSRAGANAVCELKALSKPNLLIPLSAKASRGDQILNARSFEKQGYSMVLDEDNLTGETLLDSIHVLYRSREKYIAAMNSDNEMDSIDRIIALIQQYELKNEETNS
ncbi:MAG: undecaprenyldiphospho-muramoylpentapeptide beta-N-acetylglucosaminyltransferase [Eubacterium sp.]|nr:undecaprenyldiphospho-muramoylpentapeptide beta-N-acetylglucosaminyltransferase [Eubacterium sp.]